MPGRTPPAPDEGPTPRSRALLPDMTEWDFKRLVFDDLRPAVYVGGEGNQLMNESQHGYWPEALFALHGRPLPVGPLLFYTLWNTAAVTLAMLFRIDAYGEPTLTLHVHVLSITGTALFFLLVFRTNAS
jgi:hypothetical protein